MIVRSSDSCLSFSSSCSAERLGHIQVEAEGARLIAHAGSLTNLAKYPASTVQILGAEKALFRALKTKGTHMDQLFELVHQIWEGR